MFAAEPEQWCRFHGPNGQGISTVKGLPVKWSDTENIAWKTQIPGNGWSSPVVWNDKIFLTSTEKDGTECRVFCVDLNTGKFLWNKMVFTQETSMKHPRNSFATPTPVTDGKWVYALFSSGKFAVLDFDGNTVWTKDIHFYSQHGLATSPILYNNLLITAISPSNQVAGFTALIASPELDNLPPEQNPRYGWQLDWDKSYLLALDKNTGKEVWQGKRGMSKIGHSSPVVISVNGKDQILSPTGSVLQSFAPDTGELIWTVQNEGEPCVPTAAIGDGCVFAGNTAPAGFRCVKIDGKGDCTATHILWEQKRNVPMLASYLYVKPCVYTATDNGSFSAFDEKTGKLLWQKRLGEPLGPSPIYADGKIYVLSAQGTTTVFQIADVQSGGNPAEPAEMLATNSIGEQYVQASLAVAGKHLLLRTEKELWCIGEKQ
ncbi:serine/threonine protein kinase [Planctomycetales bacterium]|nr:serine/threonine protein kinase [Planctomycetales bacterium]